MLQNPRNTQAINTARQEFNKAAQACSTSVGRAQTAIQQFTGKIDPEYQVEEGVQTLIGNVTSELAAVQSQVTQMQNLGNVFQRFPITSGQCATAAQQAANVLGKSAEIVEITSERGERFWTLGGERIANFGWHQAVKVGDRIYDAMTGPLGMTVDEYIQLLKDKVGITPTIGTSTLGPH